MTPFLPVLLITPILLLLSLGIVVFVLRYQKRLIAHQQHLRELQEARQRQVLEAALEAQEAERRRVARDLHDEVGAMLALVKLQVGQLSQAAVAGTATTTGQTVKQQLDEVMGSVRRISHDLMPVMLEKYGLLPALESLKRAIPEASGITLELTCHPQHRQLPPKTELTIFRVVQELLNNSLKHSQATSIRLELQYDPGQLLITYSDNGKGFRYTEQPEGQPAKAGLGLTNLQSRVELLDGTFHFFSEEGAGVKATIVVPIV